MTPLVVEATYENGALKVAQPLPLKEHAQVRVTIEPKTTWADATYGMLGWKGTHEQLQQILAEAEELPVTFADLAAGESVFLDANPLVYHLAPDPYFGPTCHRLITRAENKEILAFTSTHVLSEVAHHLMTLEASALFGWTSKVVDHLRQQPTAIQKLINFRQAIEKVPHLSIQVLTVPTGLIATAAAISQQFGLLSNDALIVAIMRANGMNHIASHDADFDRVPGITRYAPT